MKHWRICLTVWFSLLVASPLWADSKTEDFESVVLVDAAGNELSSTFAFGKGLSNGWKVVGGDIYASDGVAAYGLWSKGAPNNTGHSLEASYGGSNNAFVVITEPIQGSFVFQARKMSSSSSTKGYIDLYEVEPDGESWKRASETTLASWTLDGTSTAWTEYSVDLGSGLRYVAIHMVRAAMDDVTFESQDEPVEHVHDYDSEWHFDTKGHWHECQGKEGVCEAKMSDYGEHDGAICSVCGYKVPGVDVFPWSETFNGVMSGVPTGWNVDGTTENPNYNWSSSYSGREGRCVAFNSRYNAAENIGILVSPLIYVPAEGAYRLSFWCKNPVGGAFCVKVSEYRAGKAPEVLIDNLTDIADWTEQSTLLSAYAGKAVYLLFCATSNAAGEENAYIAIDDVVVKEYVEHVHDYAAEWSFDRLHHWHACLSEVGECAMLRKDEAEHEMDENDVCQICGYDRPYQVDFTTEEIPELWINNGWNVSEGRAMSSLTQSSQLTTSFLKAREGETLEVVALLQYTDEPLLMEYSDDEGIQWAEVFCVASEVDHYSASNAEVHTETFVAPHEGEYVFRFTGKNVGLRRVTGMKDLHRALDIETGMEDVREAGESIIYDLNGRRTNDMQPGQVYIVGRKKVILK